MSNGEGLNFWVGDLDGYVSISAIERANKAEQDELQLQVELDAIGDIGLLAGTSLHSRELAQLGIRPPDWRWGVHQGEQALRDAQSWSEIERPFVSGLLALGRKYAVNRYAAWEDLPRSAAWAATLPYGFKALLEQYLMGEGLRLGRQHRALLNDTLDRTENQPDVLAYHRVGALQSAIHRIARDLLPIGPKALDRHRTRTILSLARLRYSVLEADVKTVHDVEALQERYRKARDTELAAAATHAPVLNGKHIRNWRLRHLHSLHYFFPRSVRNAFLRAVWHGKTAAVPPDRTVVVNELALAHCSLRVMPPLSRRARGDR